MLVLSVARTVSTFEDSPVSVPSSEDCGSVWAVVHSLRGGERTNNAETSLWPTNMQQM